ncbi:unnamed protein product, partial [Staurois parvus]
QCHPPVPTHLCPPLPPTCAHQCPSVRPSSAASQWHQSSVPSSDASQCHLSVLSISTHHQCRLSVPPIRDTSLVLPISAAYPCHLISAASQYCLSVPISAASYTHISEGEKLPV